tara:strand:+ start:114 stop:296 length:183 start_codon:yes stop_codon:yes gene_type:complete
MLNEDEQRELHKQLTERVKQLRMDQLFEEPCSLYDDEEDEEDEEEGDDNEDDNWYYFRGL